MGQDNRGALVNRFKIWVSQMWLNLLKSMMTATVIAEKTITKESLESARSSSTKIDDENREFLQNFETGQYVKFIDLLGHDEKAWSMDRIEFKILKNYLGKTGKIIDCLRLDDVPSPYNMFLTVKFKDNYTIYDANYFAFGPPEFRVIDFVKEKEKLQQARESNE